MNKILCVLCVSAFDFQFSERTRNGKSSQVGSNFPNVFCFIVRGKSIGSVDKVGENIIKLGKMSKSLGCILEKNCMGYPNDLANL